MQSLGMAFDILKAELVFPVAFDLRIIYILSEGGSIREDVERALAARGAAWSLMQADAGTGGRYGRFGVRVTMTSREQMYGVYEDLGKLPYVKTAI
jgi:putative lipoic acid-binding regulatory protein